VLLDALRIASPAIDFTPSIARRWRREITGPNAPTGVGLSARESAEVFVRLAKNHAGGAMPTEWCITNRPSIKHCGRMKAKRVTASRTAHAATSGTLRPDVSVWRSDCRGAMPVSFRGFYRDVRPLNPNGAIT